MNLVMNNIGWFAEGFLFATGFWFFVVDSEKNRAKTGREIDWFHSAGVLCWASIFLLFVVLFNENMFFIPATIFGVAGVALLVANVFEAGKLSTNKNRKKGS